MAGFFGPGGLSQTTSQDPTLEALLAKLKAQYPHVFTEPPTGAPPSLGSLGYQGLGPQFPGASTGSLTLFEGGKGVPESLTGALATGTARGSSFQPIPNTGAPSSFQAPDLQIPGVPSLPSFNDGSSAPIVETTTGPQTEMSGGGPGLIDLLGTGANAVGGALSFLGSGPQPFDPTGQTSTQAYQDYRKGERDYSWATGSPSGIPQFNLGDLTSAPSGPGALTGLPVSQATIGQGVQNALNRANQLQMIQQYGQAGNIVRPEQAAIQAFMDAGLSPDEIQQVMGGAEVTAIGGSGAPDGGPGGGSGLGFDLSKTDYFNALLGLLSGVTGGLNLASGIKSGDPGQIASGAVGTYDALSALSEVAKNANLTSGSLPNTSALAQNLMRSLGVGVYSGLDLAPEIVASLSSGSAASAADALMGGTVAGVGTGSASNLASGIDLGSAIKLVLAGLQAAGVFNDAAGQQMMRQVQIMTAPIVTQVGGMLGPYGAAVAMAAMAVADTISFLEESARLKSGRFNNPIKGALYSSATEGVLNANNILDQLGGDYSGISTNDLLNALVASTNSVLPYYQTAQGGVGAIRASDTAGSPGTQPRDVYTQNFTNAKDRIAALTKELLNRGLTYDQLGQLPIDPAWTGLSLDAGGRPEEFYLRGRDQYTKTAPAWTDLLQSKQILVRGQNVDPNLPNYEPPQNWDEAPRYQPEYRIAPPEGLIESSSSEGQGFYHIPGEAYFSPWEYAGAGINGSPIRMDSLTPDNAFIAALGAVGYDPNAMTPQEQLKGKSGVSDVAAQQGVASMYGGPLWAAMARMGQNEFTPMIQERFNPWATWSTLTPDQRLTAMGPTVFGPTQMVATSGPGGEAGNWVGEIYNPRLGDFFAGLSPAPLRPGYTPPTGLPPVTWEDIAREAYNIPSTGQQEQAFADFLAQLQGYVGQAQQLPGIAPTPTTATLGPDWAATFAALPASQRELFRGMGLDPEALEKLKWLG